MPIPQILYNIGYAVCHQLPWRTFHVHDQALPLCSRCTGIYLGMFLTFAFYFAWHWLRGRRPTIPPTLPIIVISALFFIIMPFNAISPHFGVPTHNIVRLITGILFGFSIPLFLLPVFNDNPRGKNSRSRIIKMGEYVFLLVAVTLATTLIIIENIFALYFVAYASMAGLVIFASLLNATILKEIFEHYRKFFNNYWFVAMGAVLAAAEFTIFFLSRTYIEQQFLP
ncbi:MAG: DUF2085 domain-containing protein [Parcubacteria group bacterium]|nr:DUF2085 domain-containing protein [Parcubacteria group bacterium]